MTAPDRSSKMGGGRSSSGPSVGPAPGVVELNLRAEIARTTTRAATIASDREFFGGIWFKIFSERGPSRLVPTP